MYWIKIPGMSAGLKKAIESLKSAFTGNAFAGGWKLDLSLVISKCISIMGQFQYQKKMLSR